MTPPPKYINKRGRGGKTTSDVSEVRWDERERRGGLPPSSPHQLPTILLHLLALSCHIIHITRCQTTVLSHVVIIYCLLFKLSPSQFAVDQVERSVCTVYMLIIHRDGRRLPSREVTGGIAYRCIQTNSPFGVDRYQNLCVGDGSPDHFISLALLEGCSSRAKEFFVDRSR